MVHLGPWLQSPWRSFCIAGSHLNTPGSCSAILVIIWSCSHRGCLLGPGPAEVAGSGLVPLRLLTWVWSCSGLWPGSAPLYLLLQRYRLGLLQQKLLTWAWSHGGHWLRPGLVEGGGSGLLPRRLLPGSCSCRGRWLGQDGFSFHLLLLLTSKFIPLSVHLDTRCLGYTRQGTEI